MRLSALLALSLLEKNECESGTKFPQRIRLAHVFRRSIFSYSTLGLTWTHSKASEPHVTRAVEYCKVNLKPARVLSDCVGGLKLDLLQGATSQINHAV